MIVISFYVACTDRLMISYRIEFNTFGNLKLFVQLLNDINYYDKRFYGK